MPASIVLASASAVRLSLLQAAGLDVRATPARIDEEAARAALTAESATPRDVADTLAELKARKVAERDHESWVIGCDQVLDFRGEILAKPASLTEARSQLAGLRGETHRLLSAVVLYHRAEPVWRHVAIVTLAMRAFSDAYLDAYLDRNWPAIGDAVGGYKLEAEGVRLFSRIDGDYFTVLGLPLVPLLSYLSQRGVIAA